MSCLADFRMNTVKCFEKLIFLLPNEFYQFRIDYSTQIEYICILPTFFPENLHKAPQVFSIREEAFSD